MVDMDDELEGKEPGETSDPENQNPDTPEDPDNADTPECVDKLATITQEISEKGAAFDQAIVDAVDVLIAINDALMIYRSRLSPELRAVVDAINTMQNAGTSAKVLRR